MDFFILVIFVKRNSVMRNFPLVFHDYSPSAPGMFKQGFDFVEIFAYAKTLQCYWHHGVYLLETVVSDSAVSLTPQSLSSWDRGIRLCGIIDTTEFIFLRPWYQTLLYHWHHGVYLLETMGSDSVVSMTPVHGLVISTFFKKAAVNKFNNLITVYLL